MEVFEKAFNWLAELSAQLPSIPFKMYFIIVAAVLVVLGVVVALTLFGSSSFKLTKACKRINKYLQGVDAITDDNLGDFTTSCFNDKTPQSLRDAWAQYVGVRFGYPSEIINEQSVYNKEVKRLGNGRANIFISIALIIVALFAFWGFGTLDGMEMGVIHCVGLLLCAIIYLVICILSRQQTKKSLRAFDDMLEDLDAKVFLQVDSNYALDSSPLAELAAITDEIVARNTSKEITIDEDEDVEVENTPIEELILQDDVVEEELIEDAQEQEEVVEELLEEDVISDDVDEEQTSIDELIDNIEDSEAQEVGEEPVVEDVQEDVDLEESEEELVEEPVEEVVDEPIEDAVEEVVDQVVDEQEEQEEQVEPIADEDAQDIVEEIVDEQEEAVDESGDAVEELEDTTVEEAPSVGEEPTVEEESSVAEEQVDSNEETAPIKEEEAEESAIEEVAEDVQEEVAADDEDVAIQEEVQEENVSEEIESVEQSVEEPTVEEESQDELLEEEQPVEPQEQEEEVIEVVEGEDDEAHAKPSKFANLPNLVDYMLSKDLPKSMKIQIASMLIGAYNKAKTSEDKKIVRENLTKVIINLQQ